MKKLISKITVLFLFTLLSGCGGSLALSYPPPQFVPYLFPPTITPINGATATPNIVWLIPGERESPGLVAYLRRLGINLQLIDTNPPTKWLAPAPGITYQIDDGWLHIHWYEDEESALQKAEEIAAEPAWSLIDWVAPPHFYRCGAAIALYLGNRLEVQAAIEAYCESLFAPVERGALSQVVPSSPDALKVFDHFPLSPGTTWRYTYTAYNQAVDDPAQIVSGTGEIRETVDTIEYFPSFILINIKGISIILESDLGWNNSSFPPGDYHYTYILQDGNLYRSETVQDPDNLVFDLMTHEFQFPLSTGEGWCPPQPSQGRATPSTELATLCEYAGLRVVDTEGAYESPVGNFENCYWMHDQYNSGGVVQVFCKGGGCGGEEV